ncbi:hypothetical protein DFH09DRAFT_1449530 [Mycena vulgaris]|nr:hypothetical protein DFH09DRAFT_1449530 [Mycena vulgaris]
MAVAFPVTTREVPPDHHEQHQALFPGASVPGTGKSKSASKRCAPCVKNYCPKRHDCMGKGAHKFCRCNHPPLKEGEKRCGPHASRRTPVARAAAAREGAHRAHHVFVCARACAGVPRCRRKALRSTRKEAHTHSANRYRVRGTCARQDWVRSTAINVAPILRCDAPAHAVVVTAAAAAAAVAAALVGACGPRAQMCLHSVRARDVLVKAPQND